MKKYVIAVICCLYGVMMQAQPFTLMSRVFGPEERIPQVYTCEGFNSSPELSWKNAPANTNTFAIICEDPDAPQEEPFVHWIIYNIPGTQLYLDRNIPKGFQLANGMLQGTNSFNNVGYDGPCPPSGKPHHYHFKLYALDISIVASHGITKKELLGLMQGHILAQTELIGTYRRHKRNGIRKVF